jgi:hypothetical protein
MSGSSVVEKFPKKLVDEFWSAPPEAFFDQQVVAQVLRKSQAWAERARVFGNGPPFRRIGRSIVYKKADVVNWLDQHATVTSTSEYTETRRATSPAVAT